MARKIFTQEVKDYIFDEIDRRGSITVDEVAAIVEKLNVFDPVAVEQQWYRDKARRLMAQRKDNAGVRTLYAPRTARATYINLETCKDPAKVNAVIKQLVEKRDGLTVAIKKAGRRATELAGQTSIFDTAPQHSSSDGNNVANL